jgi:hypothetical protein
VFDVDQVRDTIEKTCEIGNPAGAFELRSAHEFFLDRNQIDGSRSFNELDHLAEDNAVSIQVEVFGPETLQNPIVILVIDQYCAEDGFFGVYIVRKCSFE